MTLTEAVYGVFFQPVQTLRELSQERRVSQGLILLAAVTVISFFFNQAIASFQGISFLTGRVTLYIGSIGLIFSFASLFIMAGLYSLISQLVFKKGNAVSLLGCMSYATLPSVLGPPLCYSFLLLGLEGVGMGITLLSSIWVMILWVVSLREALDIDTSRSILLFLLPPAFILVFFLIALTGLFLALLGS